jgi:hypothetical protein
MFEPLGALAHRVWRIIKLRVSLRDRNNDVVPEQGPYLLKALSD